MCEIDCFESNHKDNKTQTRKYTGDTLNSDSLLWARLCTWCDTWAGWYLGARHLNRTQSRKYTLTLCEGRAQRYQPVQVYDRAQSNESELRVAPALDNVIVLLLSDLVWEASSQFRSGATGSRPFGGRTAA